jgi:phage terminase large subunit-like protein
VRAGDGGDIWSFVLDKGVITKDSFAGRSGEPLVPLAWEKRLVLETFARNPASGRRRFRTAFWSMARKNGKTGLAAPIALDGLILQGDGAEVYSCAADRDQAKLVFRAAKRTVEMDPELSAMLKLYRDAIEFPETGSVYRALSSEAYTKEGLSPTLVIADELHAWPNRDLYDVMNDAMGARYDALMLIVSTAGVRTDTTGFDSIAYQLYQYGKRCASGDVDDPAFYFAAWEAVEGASPIDTAAHAEANPGLGVILDPDEIMDKGRKALVGGTSESDFRIKRLNQWVASQTSALPPGTWDSRRDPDHRQLQPGERVVLMLDGSINRDSTGLVACTMDGFIEVIECWEAQPDDPHWRIDRGVVEKAIVDACDTYDVVEVDCDPFRWEETLQEMAGRGLPIVEYHTSSLPRIIPAWQKFYDAVTGASPDHLTHSGDPRMARHLANTVMRVDRNGARPVREYKGSPRHIDLGICAVAAFDRATTLAAVPPTRSMYEDGGLRSIGRS